MNKLINVFYDNDTLFLVFIRHPAEVVKNTLY